MATPSIDAEVLAATGVDARPAWLDAITAPVHPPAAVMARTAVVRRQALFLIVTGLIWLGGLALVALTRPFDRVGLPPLTGLLTGLPDVYSLARMYTRADLPSFSGTATLVALALTIAAVIRTFPTERFEALTRRIGHVAVVVVALGSLLPWYLTGCNGWWSAYLLVMALVIPKAAVARLDPKYRRNQTLGSYLPDLNHCEPPARVFGSAGAVADSVDRFGEARVSRGVAGERYTAELLKFFATIPGVAVFHSLRFPGSRHADIDHAVLFGTNLLLIDSKMYRPGDYTLNEWSQIRDTVSGRLIDNHMKAAVDKIAQRFPHLFVTAMIVIHGEGVTTSGTSSDHRLSIETPRSFVDWGAWVTVHSQKNYQPGLARQLAAQLKGWQGEGAGVEPPRPAPRARRAGSRNVATRAPFTPSGVGTPAAGSARGRRRHPPRTPGPRDWSPPRRGR
ncbi:nuclease-related domain-containing protein [Tersicoccus sp. Bi-70]|uniref:nuclease-related domain-containing protein n=1 Tax=Tersicoccus sp. Bi-70 TaxID=1897634 RepID=UPI0018E9A231|nr:nuclease-related domain-containing protein [Tersicoccus sp. Bi-70]